MIMHDFDPIDHSTSEFTEFCERLEFAEDLTTSAPKYHKSQMATAQKGETTGSKLNAENKKRKAGKGKYYCMLHGENNTHATDQCKVLKTQADRMSATYKT